MYDEQFMRRAIALSEQALSDPGAKPFGAVVVKDGKIVGEGLNRSPGKFDPTSHGEVEAIRDACAKLKTLDLTGCDIYTSAEPCVMCVSTMLTAGIARMYYGATVQDCRILARGHVMPADQLRQQAGLPVGERRMPAEHKLGAEALAVIARWADAAPGRRAD